MKYKQFLLILSSSLVIHLSEPVWSDQVTEAELTAASIAYVGPGGGFCLHPSIQDALDANFSEIRLLDGVSYQENINIYKSVEITGGYASCGSQEITGDSIIDGNGSSTELPSIRVVALSNDTITFNNLKIIDGAGGVRVDGGQSTVVVNNSIISSNNTYHSNGVANGGGLYVVGAGVTLFDTNITMNTAQSGGGIYCKNAQITLLGSTSITNNNANSTASTAGGGGVYVDQGCDFNHQATGIGISYNKAVNRGGGIYARSNEMTNPASITLSPFNLGFPNGLDDAINMFANKAGTAQDPKEGAAIFARGYSDVEMERVEIKLHEIGSTLISLHDASELNMHCDSYGQLCNFISNNTGKPTSGQQASKLIEFLSSDSFPPMVIFTNHSISYTKFYNNEGYKNLMGVLETVNSASFSVRLQLFKSLIVDNNINGIGSHIIELNTGPVTTTHTTFANNNQSIAFARMYDGALIQLSHSLLSENTSTPLIDGDAGVSMNIDCTISDYNDFTESGINTLNRSTKVADIKFVDAASGNYHLKSYSPAVDYCIQHSIDTNGKDIDGNTTGLDNPYMNDLYGSYDIGADEADVFVDLIFEDGFEQQSNN